MYLKLNQQTTIIFIISSSGSSNSSSSSSSIRIINIRTNNALVACYIDLQLISS